VLISSAYAQSGGPAAQGFPTESLLVFGIAAVFMYFMMIRPQMKRQKETKAMLEALKVGDEVISAGGILGKIIKVNDPYVTLEIASNTQIVVQRAAIGTLLPKGTLKSL
jgi:preprotein translocase subunit YajC